MNAYDRIHSGYPDTALNDADSGIDQRGVEGCGELGVLVLYQEPGGAAVATGLGHPVPGGMRGDAEVDRPGNLGGYDSCELANDIADSCALKKAPSYSFGGIFPQNEW
ncbi:hypothetical protein ABGB18_48105, partial [Nonomuraea sp. B12E4]|uniref:hypothetical protein n=1 Tax=Nonomuraea sp. B12E4 TaxID=3153564 RepID=UPI00325ED546